MGMVDWGSMINVIRNIKCIGTCSLKRPRFLHHGSEWSSREDGWSLRECTSSRRVAGVSMKLHFFVLKSARNALLVGTVFLVAAGAIL
jgi:hypothetical protein